MAIDTDDKTPAFQAFYIEAMLFTTMEAVKAFETFTKSITIYSDIKTEEAFKKFDFDSVLDQAHKIILAGGTLTSFLWPLDEANADHQARAKFLREALEVGDNSPLADPNLRGNIENFDAKIDSYMAGGIKGEIVPRYVGALDQDREGIHLFRGYDPQIGTFELLGQSFKLQPITEEIVRVHNCLLGFQKNNYRFKG